MNVWELLTHEFLLALDMDFQASNLTDTRMRNYLRHHYIAKRADFCTPSRLKFNGSTFGFHFVVTPLIQVDPDRNRPSLSRQIPSSDSKRRGYKTEHYQHDQAPPNPP
jgi:hypothetical protein